MTLYANIDTQAGPELSVPGGIYDSVSFPGGPPWSFALKAGWRKLSSEIPPVPTGKKRSTLKFVQDPDNAESCTFTATYTDLVYSISKMKLCDAMEARELTTEFRAFIKEDEDREFMWNAANELESNHKLVLGAKQALQALFGFTVEEIAALMWDCRIVR